MQPVEPWRWRDGRPSCSVHASVPAVVVVTALATLLAEAGLRVEGRVEGVVARPRFAGVRNALAWCTPIDFLTVPTVVVEVRSDAAPTSEVGVRVLGDSVSKVRPQVVRALNAMVHQLRAQGVTVTVDPWRPWSRFRRN